MIMYEMFTLKVSSKNNIEKDMLLRPDTSRLKIQGTMGCNNKLSLERRA